MPQKEATFLAIVLLFVIIGVQCLQKSEKVLNSGRCKARCLEKFSTAGTPQLPGAIKGVNLVKCRNHENCSQCLLPCDQEYRNEKICNKSCKNFSTSCLESCQFLQHIYTYKAGTCRNPADMEEFAAACIQECKTDYDCKSANQKCCDNGCGSTCQEAIKQNYDFPPMATITRFRERKKGHSVEVTWKPSMKLHNISTITSSPVLYVLQYRWNIGDKPVPSKMTAWQLVGETVRHSAIVRQVKPGFWYQFQLATVNANGTLGYSKESKAFKLSQEPKAPSVPQNITDGNFTLRGRKVDLDIHWAAPSRLDLPITKYKIFWSPRLSDVSHVLVKLPEYKDSVSGNKNSYTLKQLDPGTTYLVQVQAMCRYGKRKLKSPRASVHFTTYSFAQNKTGGAFSPSTYRGSFSLGPVRNITIQDIYFQNGLLKANVTWVAPKGNEKDVDKYTLHWTPESCEETGVGAIQTLGLVTMAATTHENYFIIYDLKYECQYSIEIQPVSYRGSPGDETYTEFQTPACKETKHRGKIKPDCPVAVPSPPLPKPERLQHTFSIKRKNITAQVSWRIPPTFVHVTGFRVTWGQRSTLGSIRKETSRASLLGREQEITEILHSSQTSVSLPSLKQGALYVVQVEVIAEGGDVGNAERILFTTPVLNKKRRKGTTQSYQSQESNSSFSIAANTTNKGTVVRWHGNTVVTIVTLLTILCYYCMH